jgi:glycerol-3-phosphate acyltransferase PlsY
MDVVQNRTVIKEESMPIALATLALLLAYLVGSVPVGVLAGKLIRGVNVREVGSGRTGSTNVYRAAGPWGMGLTCLGDAIKGILAIAIAQLVSMFAAALVPEATWFKWIEPLAGIAAVAGHNWSVFLKFKGGAGTVTTVGILAAMNVYVTVAVVVAGLIAMLITRMASIGSITLAIAMAPALAIAAATKLTPWAFVVFGVVAGALTIYALLPNIRRIKSGQERQLQANR